MRLLPYACLFVAVMFAADTITVFDHHWTVPNGAEWKITQEEGQSVLQLLVGHDPDPSGPRRPFQFAIADTPNFESVTVEADVKPLARSLMIVYAYQDAAHFDYAHLSTDTAGKQIHHNGIFHVYGGERVRISAPAGRQAFEASKRWYHVVLTHDGKTGTVNVQVDGVPIPALHAVDLSLTAGKVGIGSFDETGEFKNVKINGVAAEEKARRM